VSHTLRAMRREDLSRVEAIYRQHAREVAPTEWLPVAHQAIDAAGKAPLAWVAVAEKGRVIGYVIGEVRSWEFGSTPAGWIIGIGVDVEHKGERAGADLLARLVGSFAQRGTRTIRTMVRRDDVRVLRFFRSAGFATGPYTELEMEVRS
jgi:ribosomal protein S18 acetylase RimI-like enzyme